MQQPMHKEINPQSSGLIRQPPVIRFENPTTTTTTLPRSQGTEAKQTKVPKTTGSTGVGRITFRPLEGKIFQDSEGVGELDLYCKFKVGWRTGKSLIQAGPGTPTSGMGDSVSLKIDNDEYAKLKVKDRSKMFPDTLGEALISLADVTHKGRLTQWVQISKDEKVTGEVQIEMTFSPSVEY